MCEEAARLLNEYNHAVAGASKAAQRLADFILLGLLGNEKTRANARVKHAREAYQRTSGTTAAA
jgi:hypothetical protein